MPGNVEREIKLRFETPDQARVAVLGLGATALRGRRLQEDALLDTADGALKRRGCALRVRAEAGRHFLTFKGPVQPSLMKLREELETVVGDTELVTGILAELGFRVWFRYQKYREEFSHGDVTIAVDETPLGTFVEIEGADSGIRAAAESLGRSERDYVVESYRTLFLVECEKRGVAPGDMLFAEG
ncbi:MAG TPA: class IV adenylate cyclase [Vicinamibacterales bacterium]|jgi:adenylate cyclase class 2